MASDIETLIGERLKERGFRRRGQRWWLPVGPAVYPIVRLHRFWFNERKGFGQRLLFLGFFVGEIKENKLPSSFVMQFQELELRDIVSFRADPRLDPWIAEWKRMGGNPDDGLERTSLVYAMLDDNSPLEWNFRKRCINFLLDEYVFPAVPEDGTIEGLTEIFSSHILPIDWFQFPKNVRARIRRRMNK